MWPIINEATTRQRLLDILKAKPSLSSELPVLFGTPFK